MSDKLRKINVLIVDDNDGDRFLYKDLLTEGDPGTEFIFREAGTGGGALKLFQAEKPDCLLLDYRLPDMHGLDILKELSENDGAIPAPVVMLTGFGDEATAVKALHLGAQEYLPKRDLTGTALCKAVNNAIKTHRKNRDFKDSRQRLELQNRELAGKYTKLEDFYQRVLRQLKKPVGTSRDISLKMLDELKGTLSLEQVSSLESIKYSCDKLTASINNLINNPGLEMGELLISSRLENVAEVVSGVVRKLRPLAAAERVKLSGNISPGLPEVPMDRYRIEQVLTNLVDNAIKFTDPGGRIEVSVSCLPESPDKLSISVSDTGIGIPTEYLEKIFERSFQVPVEHGSDQSGLGLGLHICREILFSHKGEIFATSIPGEGSCITFTLPVITAPVTEFGIADPWSTSTFS